MNDTGFDFEKVRLEVQKQFVMRSKQCQLLQKGLMKEVSIFY